MNVDFIKAKVRLLHGAPPAEKETLLRYIGVCAGVLRSGEYMTPQRRDAVTTWLRANAVRLQLPQLPIEL